MATVSLSAQSRADLFNAYWRGRSPVCPACSQSPLKFDLHEHSDGWFLMATCGRCGLKETTTNAEDVIEGGIKPWGDRGKLITDRFFRNQDNPCPNCGTVIIAKQQGFDGGEVHVHFRCPRCLQSSMHLPDDLP